MRQEARRVCAVVVTYNRIELLKRCIQCLEIQSIPCDILVIDNASADGTNEWLLSLKSDRIDFVRLPRNTGGAGGFHVGVNEAVLRGYDYIWIMDDDTLARSDALLHLMEAANRLCEDFGWLCSVALWTDGKECKMNRPKLFKRFFEEIDLLQYGIVRAEQATFVSLFCRASMIKEAGLPIKEFFIWGDDIEFTRRLAVRMKKKCYVVGRSTVVHAMQKNNGSSIATDEVEKISRYRYAFRNENYLYRQEGMKGILYYFAKCGKHLALTLTQANDQRMKRCAIVVAGMFDGFLFNPQIEYIKREGKK